MTYYTVYKVTNKLSGKFYIGTHKTTNLDDNYYGSGKYLKYAIEKHGIENFEKEILFVFDNPEDMFDKEAEIVNEDFLAEENTYNLKVGGFGGWDYVNSNKTPEIRDKQIAGCHKGIATRTEKFKKDSEWRKNFSDIRVRLWQDPNYRKRVVESLKGREPTFAGKKHTDEAKKKIGEANSIHQKSKKNSQYGTRWIHSLTEKRSMKIKKDDPLPEGWLEGRKMKF